MFYWVVEKVFVKENLTKKHKGGPKDFFLTFLLFFAVFACLLMKWQERRKRWVANRSAFWFIFNGCKVCFMLMHGEQSMMLMAPKPLVVRAGIQEFFDSKDGDFYTRGINNLVDRWKEIIHFEGDYCTWSLLNWINIIARSLYWIGLLLHFIRCLFFIAIFKTEKNGSKNSKK